MTHTVLLITIKIYCTIVLYITDMIPSRISSQHSVFNTDKASVLDIRIQVTVSYFSFIKTTKAAVTAQQNLYPTERRSSVR